MGEKIGLVAGILLLTLGIFIFKPVPIVSEAEALEVRGILEQVYESGSHDVSVVLKDHSQRYYINRGLQYGLHLDSLSDLVGKEVVVKYPKYWTPLDWNNTVKHVSKLEYNGSIIFNELRE